MNWEDIIGHQRQVQVLQAVLNRRRNAHAYLFVGESSVGKRTVAQATASALACTNEHEGDVPCGTCSSCCRPVVDHPDIHEIVPSGTTIKIEQIRVMQRQIMFRPTVGRRKIYIIDQAASMTIQAQNAFLKSLEEPPSFVVFLLVTEHVAKLLPTVRSRCVPLRFNTVPIHAIAQRLIQDGIPEEQAKRLASASVGRPGYVLRKNIQQIETERETITRWVEQLLNDRAAVWHVGNGIEELGDKAPFFIDLLILYLRQKFLIDTSHQRDANSAHDVSVQTASKNSQKAGIASGIEALLKLKEHWERHANVRLALDVALIKLQRGLRSA